MIKNKIDYKLINIAIIAFIIFLLYMTSNFWFGLVVKILTVLTPFILAFALAHALYPLLKAMEKKGIPKMIGIGIISIFMFGLVALIMFTITPVLFEQISGLYSAIIKFIQDISNTYNINLGSLQQSLSNTFSPMIDKLGTYISDGAWTVINKSISIVASLIIVMFVAIYFLIDMGAIRKKVGSYLKLTNEKTFNYIKRIDYEMSQYSLGMGKVMAWQLFEYTFAYYLINHPNYLLLGILASVTTVIPYIGAILTNVFAAITAFVISPHLFYLTIATIAILSAIDSYIVSPRIFGSTNKVHPLVTIFAVFAGSILGGVIGIIISLPVAIIIINTFKYYQDDIFEKLKK